MKIEFTPIGIIHSPYKSPENMPIQPAGSENKEARVEVFEKYRAGLKDLDGFSHVILIYHFHKSREYNLHVTPFLDQVQRGLFATRAPRRPNSIGLSVVELLSIRNNHLFIKNPDMLDGTPLLDIKPFVPAFDQPEKCRVGWIEKTKKTLKKIRSDRRFV